MKKTKNSKYLTLKDKVNLLIALDEWIRQVETWNAPRPHHKKDDKRYLTYLKTLRKKL